MGSGRAAGRTTLPNVCLKTAPKPIRNHSVARLAEPHDMSLNWDETGVDRPGQILRSRWAIPLPPRPPITLAEIILRHAREFGDQIVSLYRWQMVLQ